MWPARAGRPVGEEGSEGGKRGPGVDWMGRSVRPEAQVSDAVWGGKPVLSLPQDPSLSPPVSQRGRLMDRHSGIVENGHGRVQGQGPPTTGGQETALCRATSP